MIQDACMSEHDIQLAILKSSGAMKEIKMFVAELDRQGVIDLFISKSEFDEFVKILVQEECLHEQYMRLDISSDEMIGNFILYYVQLLAKYMYANKYNATHDVAFGVKQFIDIDRDPRNIMSVYLTLVEFSYKVSQAYDEAMNFHFSIKENEYVNTDMNTNKRRALLRKLSKLKSKLHIMFMEVFLLGAKYTTGTQNWINANKDIYSKIDFNSIISSCPYDDIQSFFDDSQSEVLITNKPKAFVTKKQMEYFCGILLGDVLQQISTNKNQTEVIINETMNSIYQEKTVLVHIRMVQACYMFYRMEYLEREEEKLVYMFSHMPELFNNGKWGNINIPS